MNARIILGLVSVVLLTSSLVAVESYDGKYRNYSDSKTKHMKKDYDRGHHRGSYDKKRYSKNDYTIRDRYTKQELQRELRRLNKQEKREIRKELRRQEAKQARKEARKQERREMRKMRYQKSHYSSRSHRVHFKDIFRLPPPPLFYSRY